MTIIDTKKKKAVLIVTPYSTGCCVALEMQRRGYEIIAFWINGFAEEMKTHVPMSCVKELRYICEIEEQPTLQLTLEEIKLKTNDANANLDIVACLAGGEAGVNVADIIGESMGLLSNGYLRGVGGEILNRRDKKVQQELLHSAGMRSVRQAGSDKFEDVEQFLQTESYPIVLKPTESAGSDGVKLCPNFEEAKEHFHQLMNSQLVNGGDCGQVLCQEFLKGKEYVVDHVSLNGVHKTMMVWVYDKRERNGSAFVYFGCVPVEADSEEANMIIPYIRKTLDILGVKNGPSHGEVIITESGPCLVEMNCRANGGDGAWHPLARGLTPGSYSQIEATADAYLNPEKFLSYPDKPGRLIGEGVEICLVSYGKGIVKSTPGFDVLKKLPACIHFESGVKIGGTVDLTIDLITCVGSVIVYHENPAVVKDDIHFIRYLENMNGLFIFEDEQEQEQTEIMATTTTTKVAIADATVSSQAAKDTTVIRETKAIEEETQTGYDHFPDAPFLLKTISLRKTVDIDAMHDRFGDNADGPPTMMRTVSLQKTQGHRFPNGPSMLRTISLQKEP
mmetsp:Transcript_27879/g.31319  ORF Transcript_27879/g.31319 Transcript_27879/m.31319 type:complete len:562 (+) Transcript_27879:206-1891(+)